MNPSHTEALLARKPKGHYTKGNTNPVVYSSIYRANVNPACDTDSNVKRVCTAPTQVKLTSSDVCHASVTIHNTKPNVTHTFVRETSHANVKHVCEANVNMSGRAYMGHLRPIRDSSQKPNLSVISARPSGI